MRSVNIPVPREWVESFLYNLLYAASVGIRFPAIRTNISQERLKLTADALSFKSEYWKWVRETYPIEWRNRYNPGGFFE